MFLQFLHDISPVLSDEVILESVICPRKSWAPGKGAGALGFHLWEKDVKYLWDVLCLTYQ